MSLIQQLSPDLSASLKARVTTTLAGIVEKNALSIFVTEAPLLAAFHSKLTTTGGSFEPAEILSIYTSTIPLSSYDDYSPYIARLFQTPCLASRINNLFAPGLPAFIAHSSATTGGTAKTLPKYALENIIPMPRNEMVKDVTICMLLNLFYTHLVEVEDDRDEGGNAKGKIILPMGPFSVGAFRVHQGISLHDDDVALMTKRLPSFNTSPHSVALIRIYRTMLLMHGLFALENPSLNLIQAAFGATIFDLIKLIKEEWGTLVQAIEDGKLPEYEGLDDVRPYLQSVLTPNPTRAAELRRINVDEEGWLKKVWPNFKIFRGIVSGPYSRVLPKLHHEFGPDVTVHNPAYGATESFAAYNFIPTSTEIFKMWEPEYYEFLDIEEPEDAQGLRQPWEVKAGKKYELVVTTRDGLWRYRVGDIVEVVGFDAADGQVAIKFYARRNLVFRIAGVQLAESELSDAITLLKDIVGDIVEYTSFVDDRSVPPSVGFLIELTENMPDNTLPAVVAVRSTLHAHLQRTSETYKHSAMTQRLGVPTIRVLAPGTFGAYRGWRAGVVGSPSGQIKVPAVVTDDETIKWLLDRVVGEL